MLVEHARNVLGVTDAVHAEYGEPGVEVVSALSCSLDDEEIELLIRPGTLLHRLYDDDGGLIERTTCNYGLNPSFETEIERSGLAICATDRSAEARAIERPDHPYFVATLYQPQLRSSPDRPHPVLVGLVRAVRG